LDQTKTKSLIRLESGLMVPSWTEATDTTSTSKEPGNTQQAEDPIARSKAQAVSDLPVQLDPTTLRVVMGSGYSFSLKRRTGMVQIYNENHEQRRLAKRKAKLERQRELRESGVNVRKKKRK
jgi:hypothetical protein